MDRKTPDELAEVLASASKKVELGASYAHYKGGRYKVEAVALLEATNEPAVVYRAEYDQRLVFIRPFSIWQEKVEWQGKLVPRFAKVVAN